MQGIRRGGGAVVEAATEPHTGRCAHRGDPRDPRRRMPRFARPQNKIGPGTRPGPDLTAETPTTESRPNVAENTHPHTGNGES